MKTKTFALAAAALSTMILAGCAGEPTRSPAAAPAAQQARVRAAAAPATPAATTTAAAPCDAPEPPKPVETKPVFAMCIE
jgi:hypothetical protein